MPLRMLSQAARRRKPSAGASARRSARLAVAAPSAAQASDGHEQTIIRLGGADGTWPRRPRAFERGTTHSHEDMYAVVPADLRMRPGLAITATALLYTVAAGVNGICSA